MNPFHSTIAHHMLHSIAQELQNIVFLKQSSLIIDVFATGTLSKTNFLTRKVIFMDNQ